MRARRRFSSGSLRESPHEAILAAEAAMRSGATGKRTPKAKFELSRTMEACKDQLTAAVLPGAPHAAEASGTGP